MAQIASESPARVRFGHTQDRHLSAAAGAAQGWSNRHEHPLSAAFDKDPNKSQISSDEFAAGEVYRTFYEAMGRKGRDSTDFLIISGSHTPFNDTQVNAIRIIEAIENELKRLSPEKQGQPWLMVSRKFCGEAWSARAACVEAGIGDPRKTWETIRLSLSKLSTAISRTRINFSRETSE